MKIFLIRHGESKSNLDGIISTDPQLTDGGIMQAKNLQNVLPSKYDKVYCSNLRRTKMTAMISLDLNATDPILRIEPDLREIEVGDNLEGKRFEEIDTSREDLKKWVYLIEDTYHEKFQTEPLSNFIKRTGDAFSKIVNQGEEDSDDTILIFSHGGTMRSILSQTLQLIAPENFSIRNTEIICIKLKDNNWKLVERITSHLNA